MNKKEKRYRQINILESFALSKKTKIEVPNMEKNVQEVSTSAADKRFGESSKNTLGNSNFKNTLKEDVKDEKIPQDNSMMSDTEDKDQQNSSDLFTKSFDQLQFSPDLFPSEPLPDEPDNPGSPVVEQVSSQDTATDIDSFPDSFCHSAELFIEECETEGESQRESPDEINLNRAPDCLLPLPALEPLENHCILFLARPWNGTVPKPYPATYKDQWDENFVRLPCSPQNKYPVEDMRGEKIIRSRWDLICASLSRKIETSYDLEEAIMRYNSQYRGKWNFTGLHTYINLCLSYDDRNHFFHSLLPRMIDMALDLPNICTQPIPMLKTDRDYKITLSQKQIGCLLLNAFFCTFPRRNAFSRNPKLRWAHEYANYPSINFNRLYFGVKTKVSTNTEKIRCLMNYFRRILRKEPCGTVTFHRQCIKDLPDWDQSTQGIRSAIIKSKGLIETEGHGMLQADFANKLVGGGVLGGGCVQEEIRFVICPEAIVSRLFVECLDDNEVLIMTGVEQYNDYSGYSDTFKWEGDFRDKTPRDSWGRMYTELVAMDAKSYRQCSDQFKMLWIARETVKAYCAFYGSAPASNLPAVATGNWGCGAFKGHPHLKFVIQLMAASQAGRDMLYVTFGNRTLRNELQKIYDFVIEKNLVVGELWKILVNYSKTVKVSDKVIRPSLYDFLCSFFQGNLSEDNTQQGLASQPTDTQYAMMKLCEDVENDDTEVENGDPG